MRKKEVFILVISIVISYLCIFLFDIGCPINKLFGIECAGCGLTRMFLAIFKFDFYQAFRFNPCMFILLVMFVGSAIILVTFECYHNQNAVFVKRCVN